MFWMISQQEISTISSPGFSGDCHDYGDNHVRVSKGGKKIYPYSLKPVVQTGQMSDLSKMIVKLDVGKRNVPGESSTSRRVTSKSFEWQGLHNEIWGSSVCLQWKTENTIEGGAVGSIHFQSGALLRYCNECPYCNGEECQGKEVLLR